MNVAGPSVPFIRPRVDGDPIGSGRDASPSKMQETGEAVVACVSQQGDFVEVRTEGGHCRLSTGEWSSLGDPATESFKAILPARSAGVERCGAGREWPQLGRVVS